MVIIQHLHYKLKRSDFVLSYVSIKVKRLVINICITVFTILRKHEYPQLLKTRLQGLSCGKLGPILTEYQAINPHFFSIKIYMKSDRGHFWDLFFPMDYCSYLITLKKKTSDWRQNISNIKVIIIKT